MKNYQEFLAKNLQTVVNQYGIKNNFLMKNFDVTRQTVINWLQGKAPLEFLLWIEELTSIPIYMLCTQDLTMYKKYGGYKTEPLQLNEPKPEYIKLGSGKEPEAAKETATEKAALLYSVAEKVTALQIQQIRDNDRILELQAELERLKKELSEKK